MGWTKYAAGGAVSGSTGVSDHGALTGLSDDDHSIYALADGSRGTFEVSGAVATHSADTTSVHGITDTSTLYYSGGTDVAVADGGTGSSSASGARTNLGIDTVVVSIQVTDPSGATLATGDGKAYFRVPSLVNGGTISAVAAHVTTVSSSGSVTVQIHNVTDTVDVLSTALTIDANEKDSATAATPAVINASNDDVATADELRIDIDGAGTGAKGLIVELTFTRA